MNEAKTKQNQVARLEIHALLAAGRCFTVEFDENNENGMKRGRVSRCQIGDLILECGDFMNGTKFDSSTYYDLIAIHIEGKSYGAIQVALWTGNMIWNTYYLSAENTLKLINDLIDSKNWSPFEGASTVYDKLILGKHITSEDLKACC